MTLITLVQVSVHVREENTVDFMFLSVGQSVHKNSPFVGPQILP